MQSRVQPQCNRPPADMGPASPWYQREKVREEHTPEGTEHGSPQDHGDGKDSRGGCTELWRADLVHESKWRGVHCRPPPTAPPSPRDTTGHPLYHGVICRPSWNTPVRLMQDSYDPLPTATQPPPPPVLSNRWWSGRHRKCCHALVLPCQDAHQSAQVCTGGGATFHTPFSVSAEIVRVASGQRGARAGHIARVLQTPIKRCTRSS